MTNEQHERFLSELDENIKKMANQEILACDESNITFCLGIFTEIKYGKKLPIVLIKSPTHEVNEFYSSELNLPWLLTYVQYYIDNMSKDMFIDLDVHETYQCCLYMSMVMTMCKGINIVNETVYILVNDVEFVSYKMDRKLFI